MPAFHNYRFVSDPEKTEIAIALLQEMPFKGFEENSTGFDGFISTSDINEIVEQEIHEIAEQLNISFEISELEDRNWNQVWEDQFQPVIIDNRVAIRAAFHPHFPEVDYELTIHPKMAFGTGHHETTTMMIQEMQTLDFKNRKVLDYGCGTGILGIFASKLFAGQIEGVDNEYPAFESTVENCEINHVNNMKAYYGTLSDIQGEDYDIILANINRNVILDSLQTLVNKTTSGGRLLFSGVLISDIAIMASAFESCHLYVNNHRTLGQWVCFNCSKQI